MDEGCSGAMNDGRERRFDKTRRSAARDAESAEQRLRRGRAEADETRGFTTAISASSHGRQARISAALGFACRRRLPRGPHLKCFTALVT